MNGNVGQQRLHETEQRVSSAGEQPSVVTRVAADEAMRQVLAASSTIRRMSWKDTQDVPEDRV